MQSDFSGLLAFAAIAYFLPTVIALLRWRPEARSSEQMICAIEPTPAPTITARSCAGADTERRAIAHARPAAATAIGFAERHAVSRQ